MRTVFAWVVGIAALVAVGVAFLAAGEAIGVASSIDLDGPTTITYGGGRFGYDEEVSSVQTTYGYASGVVAVLIALWAGQAVYRRRLDAGFSERGSASFLAWLAASLVLVVVFALVHLAFARIHGTLAYYARLLIELGALGGVGWAAYHWYKRRVAHMKAGGDV